MKMLVAVCALLTILVSNLFSASNLNGTVEWNRLEISDPPPQRYYHSQVFDAKRNTITIFGGWHFNSKSNSYTMYDDVWQANLNDSTWNIIESDTKPSPRGAYAILDSVNDRFLLFGGFSLSNNNFYVYDDLWEFNLNSLSWNLLAPIGEAPTNIGVATLVYDSIRNRIVFFGGEAHNPPYEALDVTWSLELDSLKWNKIETNSDKPPARWAHGAIYDAIKDRMIIFGGKYEDSSFTPKYLNDVWALNLETNEWQELKPNSAKNPSARAGMAMIHDIENDRFIIFGGTENESTSIGSLNDTWEFNLFTFEWSEISAVGDIPKQRSYITANLNRSENKLFIFGGNNSYTEMLNDAYELCLPTSSSNISSKQVLASEYHLYQNYPNPFNSSTKINFSLGSDGIVNIQLYDTNGNLVRELGNTFMYKGNHSYTMSAKNLASGVYIYRIQVNDFQSCKKLLLIK
jgi:N-acetylneuraminic acid mutarotase